MINITTAVSDLELEQCTVGNKNGTYAIIKYQTLSDSDKTIYEQFFSLCNTNFVVNIVKDDIEYTEIFRVTYNRETTNLDTVILQYENLSDLDKQFVNNFLALIGNQNV